MLDRDPDGGRVRPWTDGKNTQNTKLTTYMRNRLDRHRTAAELDDDQLPPNPAECAVSFTTWAHRMHRVHGSVLRRDSTDTPVAARARAVKEARSRQRGTPAQRARRHGAQQMNTLGELALVLVERADQHGFPSPGRHHDTTGFLPPGNELALLLDPGVHQALQDFVGAPRREPGHVGNLSRAVRAARHTGALGRPITYSEAAEPAAKITRPDGTPAPQTTLRYLIDRML